MDDSWSKLWENRGKEVTIMGDRFDETWLGKVKIEGDKLREKAEKLKAITKEIHDSCRPCPKLVAECAGCNLGMIKEILMEDS